MYEHDISFDPRIGEYVIFIDPGDGQSFTLTKSMLEIFLDQLIEAEWSE